jgi:hypothetical protein
MSIFDLEDVSKKEKKVIQMGKKLQKEKIIISHSGEVKKEENETTLMIKNMKVEDNEDTETVENEETEVMEQEESELPLQKEIEQEVEAQTGIVISEGKDDVRESKREIIVDQFMDDLLGKYDTNFSAEEEVIITEYKEHLLKNYLDETVKNLDETNKSFFEENNKSYNGKDINAIVSEDLKNILKEIPSKLKEAEETGEIEKMIQEKEIQMKKTESEPVQEEISNEVEVQEEPELTETKEEFKMIIIKETNENIEEEVEDVKEEVIVDNEEKVVVDEKVEVVVENKVEVVVDEVVEVPEKVENVEEVEENEVVEVVVQETENIEKAEENEIQEEEVKTNLVEENTQNEANIDTICQEIVAEQRKDDEVEPIKLAFNKRTVEDEEMDKQEEVILVQVGHEDNDDENYEHKLENIEDYIQDADEVGFFDKLVEEKRSKERRQETVTETVVQRTEKPSSERNMLEYIKNQQNRPQFGQIKNQLMIEANIRPKEEVRKVTTHVAHKKENSDIEFENAFESEEEVRQEVNVRQNNYNPVRVQPAPVRAQPAPVRVQPAPVKVQPAPVRAQPAPVRVQPAPTRAQPTPVRVQPKINNGVSQVITTSNIKTGSKTDFNLDSFDIRRYDNHELHSLAQSKLSESGTWGESLRSSRPKDVRAVPQDRTSLGKRPLTTNSSRIALDTGRTNLKNTESTKQTYQRFESVKEMKKINVDSQIRKNKFSTANWNSNNSTVKTSVSHRTPTQVKTSNSRLVTMNNNEYKNSKNDQKVSTLSSIIQSNIGQTSKKYTSYQPRSITTSEKKEYSNTRTPTNKLKSKKKINLSHYRSKKVNTVSTRNYNVIESQNSGQKTQNETVTSSFGTGIRSNNSGVRVQTTNYSSSYNTKSGVTTSNRIGGQNYQRTQINQTNGVRTPLVSGSSSTKRRIKI